MTSRTERSRIASFLCSQLWIIIFIRLPSCLAVFRYLKTVQTKSYNVSREIGRIESRLSFPDNKIIFSSFSVISATTAWKEAFRPEVNFKEISTADTDGFTCYEYKVGLR